MSEDPIGFDGDDENLCRYVDNAPLDRIDPSGLEPRSRENRQRDMRHLPGALASYPDGSGGIISRDIDPGVLEQMMRPGGRLHGGNVGVHGPWGGQTGMNITERSPAEEQYQQRVEKERARNAAMRAATRRVAFDLFTAVCPVISDIRDAFELLTGRDLITLKPLTTEEWQTTLMGNMIPVASGRELRAASNAMEALHNARSACRRAADDVAEAGRRGAPVKEGIYEFPDQTAGGRPYVGQSENVPGRLGQHEAAGRLTPGTESTTPVSGGKTAREIAEHDRIQQLTGEKKARNSPAVSNQRDPIGPKRRPGFGLPEPQD